MCLAILIPHEAKLLREHAAAGFFKNKEGAGFAYIDNGKVIVEKGFFDFEEFWQKFDAIQQTNVEPKLVHFRIATCGKVCAENCHPWVLNDNAALIHNGTFGNFKDEPERISDTGLFVERVLLPVFEKYKYPLPNKGLSWMMEKIFLNQKVAIIYKSARKTAGWMVFSPQSWIKEPSGESYVWFSNTSYKHGMYLTYPEINTEHYSKKRHRRNNYKCINKANKRRKHHQWRIVGETEPLTPKEINLLTQHTYRGKNMKRLEAERIVEKCWSDDLEIVDFPTCGDCNQKHHIQSPCDRKDPSYIKFWMNKDKMNIFSRDEIYYQGLEN